MGMVEQARLEQLIALEREDPALGQAADLERRTRTLPERGMRRAVVVEHIEGLDEVELVALLAGILWRSMEGEPGARVLLQELALEPSIFEELPYERVGRAYAIAREGGLAGVAAMFLGDRANQNPSVDEAFKGNQHLDIPLGVRRAAARSGDRNLLDRLLHDRDHRVIRILLDNPRIVERDVIRVAASRPQRPEVLAAVATHARWSARYRVRKALACNPYTPAPIARRLLPTLQGQDLVHAAEAGGSGPGVQEEVRALMDNRRNRTRSARRGALAAWREIVTEQLVEGQSLDEALAAALAVLDEHGAGEEGP